MKPIHKTLQRYRKYTGIYYSVIDQKLEFDSGTTALILGGKKQPTLEELAKLSVILKISLNRILPEIGYCKGELTDETKRMLVICRMVRHNGLKETAQAFGISHQQLTAWMRYSTIIPSWTIILEGNEYEVIQKRKWWQLWK